MEDDDVLMNSLRNMMFMLVFLWMGIIFTKSTLADRPRDEWTSATIQLGVVLTVTVVVVEVAYQVIQRRQRRQPGHASLSRR